MLLSLVPSFITIPTLSCLFLITNLVILSACRLVNGVWLNYLRSQVESEITASSQSVLHQQRDLVGKAKLDRFGKPRSLAEVDKVFQREGQGDRFGKLDLNVHLWFLDVAMASQSDGTVSNITRAGELDTVLGCFDGDC